MHRANSALCRGTFGIELLEPRQLLSADFVLDWNATALQAVADDHTPSIVATPDQGGPTRTARALAIVHAAIFDAADAIDGSIAEYLIHYQAPKNANIEAAIAQAGHDTLASLYPHQVAKFDSALTASLNQVPDGRSEALGVLVGKYVARKMLAARAQDGSELAMSYAQPIAAGVFEPFPGEPLPLTPQ